MASTDRRTSSARRVFMALALASWAMWIAIGIPIFYGAMGSLAATPLLSVIVFLRGRRRSAPVPGGTIVP